MPHLTMRICRQTHGNAEDKDNSSSNVMNTAQPMYEWNQIPWRKLDRMVFKLQKRIYQASLRGDVRAVRRLQKLLVKSWSARIVAERTSYPG